MSMGCKGIEDSSFDEGSQNVNGEGLWDVNPVSVWVDWLSSGSSTDVVAWNVSKAHDYHNEPVFLKKLDVGKVEVEHGADQRN